MLDEVKKRFEQAILKSGRFDSAFEKMEILSLEPGRVKLRLPVDEKVQNLAGKLHGGASATLVDLAGTIAIMTADRQERSGVSVDLNVTHLAPGEGVVLIDATVLKSGKTLSFVGVDIRRESDGVLVAQGRMTKAMG
jgi:acyl-coenzyme A thioesterase 13